MQDYNDRPNALVKKFHRENNQKFKKTTYEFGSENEICQL